MLDLNVIYASQTGSKPAQSNRAQNRAQNRARQWHTAMQLGTFKFDATPPLGHGCCGGWITPVVSVDDALECIGVVLLPAGELPVVVCTLDWTGLANAANATMRTAMAEAVGTTPERVSIHVVHPHNAPMACTSTEELLLDPAVVGTPLKFGEHPLDLTFFDECVINARAAAKASLTSLVTVGEIATGKAEVFEVAANRRVDVRTEAPHCVFLITWPLLFF